MRWDRLFEDIESRFGALERAHADLAMAEAIRGEIASLTLVQELVARIGCAVRIELNEGTVLDGVIDDVGQDWLFLDELGDRAGRSLSSGPVREAARQCALIATRSVGLIEDHGQPPRRGQGQLSEQGLARMVVPFARGRDDVTIVHRHGRVTGTIDRVGSDFLVVRRHPHGEPRVDVGSPLLALTALVCIIAWAA